MKTFRQFNNFLLFYVFPVDTFYTISNGHNKSILCEMYVFDYKDLHIPLEFCKGFSLNII